MQQRVIWLKTRPARAAITTWFIVAGLSGGAFGSVACGDRGEEPHAARIDALETKVQQLTQQLEANAPNGTSAVQRSAARANDAASFELRCLSPWRALGPVGDAAWTCRADRPTANGLWPNCNVTVAPTEPDVRPSEVFESTLAAVPQLKAARRLGAHVVTLANAPAYEAIYEHDLLPSPLRVLATVGVRSDRAYAISCSAPPEDFAANEAMFRRITASFHFK